MQKKIYIKSFASISSLGISSDEVWDNYCHNKSQITFQKIGNKEVCASSLSKKEKVAIEIFYIFIKNNFLIRNLKNILY